MAATAPPKLPPKLREGKSDQRETFRLINAMRDQMVAGNIGGGGQFSTRFSTNILGSNLGTEEVVGQVEIPEVLSSFTAEAACQETSSGGAGVIRLRLGGGDGTPDGDVLLTIAAPASASFIRVFGVAPFLYLNTNSYTRLKWTLASFSAGNYLKVADAAVTLL